MPPAAATSPTIRTARAPSQRAVARGELPADADPATIAAVLLGPLFYRRWFSREPLDDAFIGTVVRHAIAGL